MSTVTKPRLDSRAVLQRVARRLRVVAFGHRFYLLLLAAGAVYGTLLLLSRFTGIPQGLVFQPVSLLLIPLAALAVTAIWHPSPSAVEAARRVDEF